MKLAYLDCFSGISGNMLLGALLHAGLPEARLRESLAQLRLPGWQLEVESSNISGLHACLVRVRTGETGVHRHLGDIRKIIQESTLPLPVIQGAMAVFTRLAEAEARVHGTTPDRIHFHEVGGVDAIIDIVGTVAGLHHLGIERLVCSPLPMPRGWTSCAHGKIPLPAPAVCELLKKVPVYGDTLEQELVTPTGAALVAGLAHRFGPLPAMTLESTGYGAGTMQRRDGRPNLLRLIIGNSRESAEARVIEVIETNLDDFNPELWPHVAERLMAAGALDVSLVPMQMKKGRPGFLVRVLGDPAHGLQLKELILAETSSIGLRCHRMERMTLPRETVSVQTPWGPVQAKRVEVDGRTRITPEYEDCRRLARENNLPLQQVYAAVTEEGTGRG